MKFPVLWLYLERATSLLVIDDYYVPPSINKVYTRIPVKSLETIIKIIIDNQKLLLVIIIRLTLLSLLIIITSTY